MSRKMWITSSHRGLVTEGLHQNTMAAYYNSYLNGAEMIEMDARMTSDGVLVSNHDAEAVGMDPVTGETVKLEVAEHTAEEICALILSDDPRWGAQHVPTLEAVLDLCYRTGMDVNIDMKNAGTYVHEICRLVWNMGMRGHVVYALNGAPLETMQTILQYDPDARFMNLIERYTDDMYAAVPDYPRRFFAYTWDFSEEKIRAIKDKGVMLACISLDENNFAEAVACHPEMCEFPHTSDFAAIEKAYFDKMTI